MIYIFDNYTLDGNKRELRDREVVIQLQPQVFDLLEFLLRNRDRVASKDEMLAAVWGGRIVSESTLASRINAARSAIGDNGQDQRLIRTFLRKGARFVGLAREVQASGVAGTAKPERLADGSASGPSALPRQAVTFSQTDDGTNLAVASVGSGPVLVRAAHWGTHVEYDLQNPLTSPLLRRLAGHFHLVRYDGRGTGLSDWSVGEISLETFLDDLETVVDSLALERFALLGCTAAPQCRLPMQCDIHSGCQSSFSLAGMLRATNNATFKGRRLGEGDDRRAREQSGASGVYSGVQFAMAAFRNSRTGRMVHGFGPRVAFKRKSGKIRNGRR